MGIESKLSLRDREKIVFSLRRYGLTFFWSWLLTLLVLALPFFFTFWLFAHGWWGQTLFFLPITLALLIAGRAAFLWDRNVAVISDQRIVDFDQRGLLDLVISDVSYDQVEDISVRKSGFWQVLGNYGDLVIQTGNGRVEIIIDRVKAPTLVMQEINELRERFIRRIDNHHRHDACAQVLDLLYELNQEEVEKVEQEIIRVKKRLRRP